MKMPGFSAEKSLDGRSNRFVNSIRVIQDPGISILLQAKMDPSKYPYCIPYLTWKCIPFPNRMPWDPPYICWQVWSCR